MHQRGMAAFQEGRLDLALDFLHRAVALDPLNPSFYNNLGIVLQTSQRLTEAIACFRRAIEIKPDMAEACSNLGHVLDVVGAYAEAEAQCRAALRLQPDFADAFNNLGNALAHQGRVEEAGASFEEALRLNPVFIEAHRNLGHVLQEKGQFAEAQREYEIVLQLNPRDALALYSLALSKRYTTADHAELARVEVLLEDSRFSAQERSFLEYTAGKISDDFGLYDKAFRHFQRANHLVRPRWNVADHAAKVDQLISIFPRARFAAASGLPEARPQPVFIVGMPRSGTSLMEQILASHPEVHGCGELKDIEDLVNWLPTLPGVIRSYPECVPQVPGNLIRQMAEWYLGRRQTAAGSARLVTDKMPTNFLHLGLIALLFPGARIIHCRRDPLDICLSCYFQNFALRPPYSFDLGDLGSFHRQYERLMQHWQAVLPLPILDVRYEELVQDLEGGTRRVLQFLRFYQSRRPVQTSSSWQVRQPLYTSSVGRWKNYARHLEPLRRALEGQSEPTSPASWSNVFFVGSSDRSLVS
jgi:tetratricopeptide (TPR) repeat protein